jgi:hypothetical protein
VSFHSTGADDELPGDLGIGHSCCHQAKSLFCAGRLELLGRSDRARIGWRAKCMLDGDVIFP